MKLASEKQEQAAIVELLELVGGRVWILGTRRPRGDYQGTRQTPGVPDLVAFVPAAFDRDPLWTLLVIEAKAPGGRLRPAQAEFRRLCVDAGVAHITGGVDAVIAWLEARGYLEAKGATDETHRTGKTKRPTAGRARADSAGPRAAV